MEHDKRYPRPQFVRDNYTLYDGVWDFDYDDADVGEKEQWFVSHEFSKKIHVPFAPETVLSGIHDERMHENVWYARTISVDGKQLEKNDFILHFEGVDFLAKLWVNGVSIGCHKGGYARFSFDISNALHDGENKIVLKAEDSLSKTQPRGKQRWLKISFACWYVQTTGIWKSVWSEWVPKTALQSVKLTPNLSDGTLSVSAELSRIGKGDTLEITVSLHDKIINSMTVDAERNHLDVLVDVKDSTENAWDIVPWTPENPVLYGIGFVLRKDGEAVDSVHSYFAMRYVTVEGSLVLLNNEPYYQKLILDQGYWPESGLTAPNVEALEKDVESIKAMGFNGVRKHQKIEDERFLYLCDKLGLLVWSEMPATYTFSDEAVQEFTREWMEIVSQNYNHPCIVTWVPFNESWGIRDVKRSKREQDFTCEIYYLTKMYDQMRPVVTNDGWEHTSSDIITVHDYEQSGEKLRKRYVDGEAALKEGKLHYNCGRTAFSEGWPYKGQPIMISEYGGIAFKGNVSSWGYGERMESKEAFIKRFDAITTAVKSIPYVCGYCYTQVSDVEQEVNGLLTPDRKFKIEPETIKEINDR